MNEGWSGDDYLVIFDETEIPVANERYGISYALPGHSIVGLFGWDDFILQDTTGHYYTVPTVPLTSKYRAPFELPSNSNRLEPDPRVTGRIKWYVKPLALGGDPNAPDNVTWIDHEKHAQLVRWWNDRLRSGQSPDDA